MLLRMQPKVHPAVERYLIAMKAYLRAVNNYLDLPATDARAAKMRGKSLEEISKLLGVVQVEKEKLDQAEGQLE